jgi:hypothetical protein
MESEPEPEPGGSVGGVGRNLRWSRRRSQKEFLGGVGVKEFLGGVGVGKNVPTPTSI